MMSTTKRDDGSPNEGACFSSSASKSRQTLLWIISMVGAIAAAIIYSNYPTHIEKDVFVSADEGNIIESFIDHTDPGRVPASLNAKRYHNMSFPCMDDHTTHVECCAARLIVKLERHYSYNLPSPFSLLMFNSSMCGKYIESIENYPNCGIVPTQGDDDGFGSQTIPEWVENSLFDEFDHEGFMFYYDNCPAPLVWDSRSCREYMSSLVDNPNDDLHIVQRNLSLVDGGFTATVALIPSGWSNEKNISVPSIFVPDVFDSCWQIGCGSESTTKECIDFAVENLVRVSLEEYINTTKRIWCE